MSEPLTIVIPGKPEGKKAAVFGKGHAYTSDQSRGYETSAKWIAKAKMGSRPLMTGPLRLRVRAHLAIPKSWSKRKQQEALIGQISATLKPDHDNISKIICDAMNGIVYVDDKQIVDSHVMKVFGLQPMVVVTVQEIAGTTQTEDAA